MRSSRLLINVAGLTLALGVCAIPLIEHTATAQGPNAVKPPFDLSDEKVIDEGRRLFGQTCTHYCHGKDGGPSRAPKLRGRHLDPGYAYARITNGTPNGMPAFGSAMPEETIWKLVAYVVSISKAEDQ
jgi:cytochrome c oxidase cbb3-type subunit III